MEVRLQGIKGRPPTPDPEAQPLNPRCELANCFEAYKATYNEIEKLVRRMTSLKIYSCDEYEIYSGSNGFLFDWLDWDKVSLALHSVELEIRRMDILHWVAVRERNPLPAEIVEFVQKIILDWKNTVHLTPFQRMDDKHGLKTLIATSGLAKTFTRNDAVSERSRPCLSVAAITEVSQNMQADLSQAIKYFSAPNSGDERYRDRSARQPSLEIDEERDISPNPLVGVDTKCFHEKQSRHNSDRSDFASGIETSESSANGPSPDPPSKYGMTIPVNEPAFSTKRQRSESVSNGLMRQMKGRRSKSESRTRVSVFSRE